MPPHQRTTGQAQERAAGAAGAPVQAQAQALTCTSVRISAREHESDASCTHTHTHTHTRTRAHACTKPTRAETWSKLARAHTHTHTRTHTRTQSACADTCWRQSGHLMDSFSCGLRLFALQTSQASQTAGACADEGAHKHTCMCQWGCTHKHTCMCQWGCTHKHTCMCQWGCTHKHTCMAALYPTWPTSPAALSWRSRPSTRHGLPAIHYLVPSRHAAHSPTQRPHHLLHIV